MPGVTFNPQILYEQASPRHELAHAMLMSPFFMAGEPTASARTNHASLPEASQRIDKREACPSSHVELCLFVPGSSFLKLE